MSDLRKRLRTFESPCGDGILAWLWLRKQTSPADVLPAGAPRIARLMILLAYKLLVEGRQNIQDSVAPGDCEFNNPTLLVLDAAINQRVAINILLWDLEPAIDQTIDRLIRLLDSGGPKSPSELAECFANFLGHTPASTLLGLRHIFRKKLSDDPRYKDAYDRQSELIHLADRAYSLVAFDADQLWMRDIVLEIHCDTDPCLVVRERTKDLQDPTKDHGLNNIVVWSKCPF